MKTINKKLNSQSGVTILFTMLLFLVATVVSLVIIVASTSSIKRETSFKETVQGNIELDSCALMIRNYFDTKELSFKIANNMYVYDGPSSNDPLDSLLISLSDRIINKAVTQDSGKCFELTGNNLTNIFVEYKIIFGNDGTPNTVILSMENTKLHNKMNSKYSVNVNEERVKWHYDRSYFGGVGQ